MSIAVVLWPYLIIMALIGASAMFYYGTDSRGDAELSDVNFVGMACCIILWPLTALIGVVSLPYWAGVHYRRLKDSHATRTAELKRIEREAAYQQLEHSRAAFSPTETEWNLLTEAMREIHPARVAQAEAVRKEQVRIEHAEAERAESEHQEQALAEEHERARQKRESFHVNREDLLAQLSKAGHQNDHDAVKRLNKELFHLYREREANRV